MAISSALIAGAVMGTILLTLFTQNNSPSLDLEAMTQFNQFKADFGKKYKNVEDHFYRFKIFSENLKNIREWQKTRSFKVGINQFSDLTWDEFKNGYLMAPRKNTVLRNGAKADDVDIDWRNSGIISKIKDQGRCGSCWAFSATGVLESFYAQNKIKNRRGTQILASEQQLVDCSTTPDGNQGCNGGLPSLAFDYILQHGLESEDDYSYQAKDL